MVIKKKKRKFQKPPAKYLWEPQATQLTLEKVKGYHEYEEECYKDEKLPPLNAVAWGWNANQRSGNATAVELREPNPVQKSGKRRYISSATGKHHSLLVSDDGLVFSFGDGRKAQLGLGNPVTSMPQKGGIMQAFPRQINPSGELRYGKDIRIVQVGAGGTFSLAREPDLVEGIELSNGLQYLIKRLKELRNIYPECVTLQKAWAAATHERSMIGRVCRGTLVMWGEGKRGQLGMGRHVTQLAYPRPIPRLNRTRIQKVAVGENHVLAITSDAELFSWGVGSGGRLGHGTYDDKCYPTKVEFFETYYVEDIAAGDRHSAVLTTSRKGVREEQTKRLCCFGRGAHGRLGNENNRNQFLPQPVTRFAASLLNMEIRAIACGGAHTLVLFYKKVKKTLANPWAIETQIGAFGFGTNGQLGTGYRYDAFYPVKVKLPKWEIISDIAAGRSWSMCRTIGGELFTWGKGMRGQIGQGASKFSLAPRKLDTFGSYVHMSAGYGHSVCITTMKKYFNPKMTQCKEVYENPFKTLIDLNPNRYDGSAKFAFDCCRRNISVRKRGIRLRCVDCNMPSICHVCAALCHRNHRLISANPPDGPIRNLQGGLGMSVKRDMGDGVDALDIYETYCVCGLESKCRVMPVVDEDGAEEHGDDYEEDGIREQRLAAESMQRLARKYLGRLQVKRMMRYVKNLRYDACELYVEKEVIGKIWGKIDEVYSEFWEERGRIQMVIEETLRKKYDYMLNMQHAIQGCEAVMYGVKGLIKNMCPRLPAESNGMLMPSYGFSWSSVRADQLNLHPHQRTSPEAFAEATMHLPRYDKYEGHCSDKDLSPYIDRFLKSIKLENQRRQEEEARKKAKAEEEAIKQKKALDRLAKLGRKKPPPPPPMSPVEFRRYQRLQAYQAEVEERERNERERDDGDHFQSTKLRDPLIIKRRHSLLDPSYLYSRLTRLRNKSTFRAYANRRNSLPLHVNLMHAPTRKVAGLHREEIKMSLEFFTMRNEEMRFAIHEDFYNHWFTHGPIAKRHYTKKILNQALMNPRGAPEMVQMIVEGQRRRTVGEPERLELQMYYGFEIRNNLAELRKIARKANNLPISRRSFDYSEMKDEESGMTELLGYDYTEGKGDPMDVQKNDLRQFSKHIGTMIAQKGLVLTDDMVWAQNNHLLSEYYERKEESEAIEEQRRAIREGRQAEVKPKWGTTQKNPNTVSSVPVVWQEHYDDRGYTFYYQVATGESSWEMPSGDIQIEQQHQDDEGLWYWYNLTTGESTWME